METKVFLTLICLEDWQGAYIDGKLIDEGHEVNQLDIINKYKKFSGASWKYLEFKTDEDFERFMYTYGGRMPKTLEECEEWL